MSGGCERNPHPPTFTTPDLSRVGYSVDSLLQAGLRLNLLYRDVEVVEVTTGGDKVDHLKNSELALPQHDTISDQGTLIGIDDGSRVILSSYDVTDFVICRHKKTLTGWSGVHAAT